MGVSYGQVFEGDGSRYLRNTSATRHDSGTVLYAPQRQAMCRYRKIVGEAESRAFRMSTKAVLHTHPSVEKARKSRSRARPKKGEEKTEWIGWTRGQLHCNTFTMTHEQPKPFMKEKN